jgi:hypothetical protein
MKTITQTKTCTKCKITKELSEFHKRKTSKDGLQSKCKICIKTYYKDNKESVKISSKKQYQQNKESIRERHKEYYEQNKKSSAAYQKEYYKQNKEAMTTQHKEYYKQNKEKQNKKSREYYELNKETRAEKSKEYRKQNKEAIAKQNKKYKKTERGILSTKNYDNKRRMMKLAKADGTIPQKTTFPLTKELQELLHIQDYKCNNCRCDITKDKHLDHHIPLSKSGTHSINNVVFLCPTCNLTKSSTMPTTLMLII